MSRNLPLFALLGVALVVGLVPVTTAKVTNENLDDPPPGCEEIQGETSITVHAGREHAAEFNGAVFTFDNRTWDIDPCTKVTVTFVNDDEIRHQFMVHGTYPYDPGFFQIEITGPDQETGTFITGADQESLLVHCGVRQHQQKGMKAQILVGGGVGDIPNIPGISGVPEGSVGGHGHAGDGHEHAHGASLEADNAQAPVPGLGAEVLALLAAVGLVMHARWRRD